MSRSITLFTGQWADLPLAQLAPMVKTMGYDGVELACWGDHFEVDRALAEPDYIANKWALLQQHGLTCQATGQKQAAWRTDPARAGASCCLGDIGTHAENLGRYITGLEIESLCADFTTFVPARSLEDDANLLLQYKGGARGILHASQISAGEENHLHIRIYGTKGALEWDQEQPNDLKFQPKDEPARILRRGNG